MNQQSLRTWLQKLENHAPGEAGHAERVAVFAVATGEALGLDDEELRHLRFASALHDIGKLQIDAEVVNKKSSLEGQEVLELRNHAQFGAELLRSIPEFELCAEAVLHHHERHDGKGYPALRSGNDIPLPSRIIAVAEAFDAMVFHCHHRPLMTEAAAVEEIRRCSGTQFDPTVVQAFLSRLDRINPATEPATCNT